MCILGIVGRPGVSWGVLGCPGVIRLTGSACSVFSWFKKAVISYLVQDEHKVHVLKHCL